ncbi:hypothetical protein [Knoellia sp. LjRoot47]|uniref:hypothetical protein n=1 Tax=Knoellia sp. LjRoot47 TaxID=3342330 RepID=UPI003ECD4BA1
MLEYTLADYDPETDGDEVDWAKRLDAQGWRTWHEGGGAWTTINGRRVKRWSLRRRKPQREA